MKMLVALLAGVSMGCLSHRLSLAVASAKRPSSDFLTASLSQMVQERLLSRNIPVFSRYVDRVQAILNEVPLPPSMDLPRLLVLQGFISMLGGAVPLFLIGPGGFWLALPVAAGGAAAPYFWLRWRLSRLHRELLKALPECLDLLALVMQAGLDLNAGIQHYLTKGAPGPLRDLLAGVHRETQMGRSRMEALSRLAQKTTFLPLRDVARGLVQALSLGTSLAPYLREQSIILRTQRMQIAEKKAAEAPLKVLFPLLVFIFPTVFIVLVGPIAIMLMHGGF